MIAYLLAIAAAASNAASNVLQRRANREEPPELSLRPRLMLDLVQRPVWLAGLGTVIASFLLMAAALSMGRLAAVQPIVVLELPLTLLLAARVFRARLGAREWAAAIAMTAGLAGLIGFLAPSGGNGGHAGDVAWAVAAGATLGLLVAVVLRALRSSGGRRAALLGIATGMTFGLTAAFMKGMTAGFSQGIAGIVTSWQTYAMIVAGLAGMFLMQNALHAGRLITAQPGITLADPAVAIVWGVAVFHEQVREGIFLPLAVASAAVLVAGTFVLARSPLLAEAATDEEGTDQEAVTSGEEGTGGSDPRSAAGAGAR